MNFRTFILLFVLAIVPPMVIASFQAAPGYLDSDYYFAGGIQLVTGKGFTEPYLWNYLDGAASLPHPSHSYWQPLASIIAALGMWLTGHATYASARIFFILIAAFVPPITAWLAYSFSQKRELAITSGLLAIFSVYNAPFVGVTDNFGIFMLLGGLYFIFVTRLINDPFRKHYWFLLGLLAGLMTLARSDGMLWLAVTLIFVLFQASKENIKRFLHDVPPMVLLVLTGFLLIMAPWYARNLGIYGSFMAPGGSRALWLDVYDQTFVYPPSQLSMQSFLALGWKEIISDRIWALGINLQSAFAAHGGIILFPFIIFGYYVNRTDQRVKLAGIAWLILFIVMTIFFPFAGARGGFFHAGAALQPIWWSLAPLGLESVLASLRKRNWGSDQTRVIFRVALVMIALILTVFVVNLRLFSLGWGEGEDNYPAIEQFLVGKGIQPDDIVIVRNPPGYYLETHRSAVSLPYGAEQAILEVSRQFKAYYLVLEPKATLNQIQSLSQNPGDKGNFIFLGEVNETRIYKIEFK